MSADLLALLLVAFAIFFIRRDLVRPPALLSSRQRVVRALPFGFFAALSLFAAARAPLGRHRFLIDFDLSWEDVARSLTKVQHLRGFALLGLLAIVAFGARRPLLAFAATMALGIATELAQATVVGHNARLADLAPDLVGCCVPIVLVAGLRRALAAREEKRAS